MMQPVFLGVLLAPDEVRSLIGRRRGRSQSGEYTHVCVGLLLKDDVLNCMILSLSFCVALTEFDRVGVGSALL